MLAQESSIIRRNVIVRGGDDFEDQRRGAIWIYAGSTTIKDVVIEDNQIIKPLFHGIDVNGGGDQHITFRRNLIDSSGMTPVQIGGGVHGSGSFEGNTITGKDNDPISWYIDHSKGAYKIIQSGNSWQAGGQGL